jgi:DNA polymerase-3 subunit gamma/tau
MSYIALYRKWRPTTFDDLVGQEAISKTLKNQIMNERIAHAYLFSGGRGTGKTSTAKIFSRAVNCVAPKEGNPCNHCEICTGILKGNIMDVIEIDAASNNSVDDVRGIRDEVFYTPSVCKYRVYIIDEVHMLSTGAFNALLKILEEPPKHVVFLLATTEPHKLPATILSRCQKFEFKQIGIEDISSRLQTIADDAGVLIDQDALKIIARMADGALRDAISILDQCMDGVDKIDKSKVAEIIGLSAQDIICGFAEKLINKDASSCIEIIEKLASEGKDISQFISMLIRYFRDILVYQSTKSDKVAYLVSQNVESLKKLAGESEKQRLIEIIFSLSEIESNLRWSNMPRVMFEVEVMKLCSERVEVMHQPVVRSIKTQEKIEIKQEKPAAKKEEVVTAGKPIEDWPKVLAQLKSSGKMVLYANLVGAKVGQIDDKTILINVAADFGKALLSKNENMKVIKEMLIKVIGHDMNIQIASGDKAKESGIEEKKESKEDKVSELAKSLDIPFNIIEE